MNANAIERLGALVGRWKTEGRTADANRIDAVDTYERLPGGALLHLVDAQALDNDATWQPWMDITLTQER
jgi:hypothetical protein